MDLVKIILMVGSIVVLLGSSHGEKVAQWGGYGEDKLSTVVIDGKLLCHDKLSTHPIPVSGSLSLSTIVFMHAYSFLSILVLFWEIPRLKLKFLAIIILYYLTSC